MCLLGLAGFSIYLLPPLVNGLLPFSPWGLGEALVPTLKASRHTFGSLAFYVGGTHLPLALAMIAFYLVPVLPCLMRSPEEAARLGSSVMRVEIWIYGALRLALLLACLWLTFDPALGPRQLAASFLGLNLPLLSFDFATALGAGFMVGTLLLRPQSRRRTPSRGFDWI